MYTVKCTAESTRLSRRRMIWLLPIPSPVDRRHTARLRKRDNLTTWEGRGGATEKVRPSINYSIFSGLHCTAMF